MSVMKSAVLEQTGKPLVIRDMPMPVVGPGEVLIQTKMCGICGTDLHIRQGYGYVPALPHIQGHEPAGVVAEIAPGVKNVKVGDRVVPHLFMACHECAYCYTGQHAQCINVKGLIGGTTHGGFAEFFKAPARNLFVLPERVSFEQGGLVACGIITAVHAVRRTEIGIDDCAVVIGVGGVGEPLVQMLKHFGVRIVSINRSQAKLNVARELGVDMAISSEGPEVAAKVQRFADGWGAHAVFDCVGRAETMKLAADCCRRRGQIIVIGEEPQFPPIDTVQIAQRELRIIGTRNGGMQDMADSIRWIARGIVQPRVAARFRLEQANEALDCLAQGKADGKIIISFE
jgi:propanol-preferring alcohol dehydrogenase